jgi:hypothetical protein
LIAETQFRGRFRLLMVELDRAIDDQIVDPGARKILECLGERSIHPQPGQIEAHREETDLPGLDVRELRACASQ